MNKIKIYQVDAFAATLFTGNPAAVCVLDKWLSNEILQSIAAENNLAETAFVVPGIDDFEIRWFTPAVEVDLCGHATLAAAYIYFNHLGYNKSTITFHSPRSGNLNVTQLNENLMLDFPADFLLPSDYVDQIKNCIGIMPKEVLKGKTDYMAILESEEDIIEVIPNFNEIAKLNARGLIITAKGNKIDFVSRFFAPQSGINEDPVTGSAHTSLIPYWAGKLGKNNMIARQLSKRGGELICKHNGNRSSIGGKAKLYMLGEIFID